MISDEKVSHIVNLMIGGLEKQGFITVSNKGDAIREAKKVCFQYLKHLSEATEAARARILSQKNAPPEGSAPWQNLYQKYYEEEVKKRGG